MVCSCRVDIKKSSIIRNSLCYMAALLFATAIHTEGSSISDRRGLLTGANDILRNDNPRYRFGGEGAGGGYDCSSFLVEAARRGGVAALPRTSREQFDLFRKTGQVWTRGMRGWGGLLPGDIVFFSGTYSHRDDCPISHVMIYAGGGKMVGAQSSGVGYHDFTPKLPMGRPGRDSLGIRAKKTIYAYARPNWSKIRGLARLYSGKNQRESLAKKTERGSRLRTSAPEAQDYLRASDYWRASRSVSPENHPEMSVIVGGTGGEVQSVRVIRPASDKDESLKPQRGVWLP